MSDATESTLVKTCRLCGEVKGQSEFWSNGPGKTKASCRACYSRIRRERAAALASTWRNARTCMFCKSIYTPWVRRQAYCGSACAHRDRNHSRAISQQVRTCQQCGTEFTPNMSLGKGGKGSNRKYCSKECFDRYVIAVTRERDLRKSYGITVQEYDRLLGQQGAVCAICGEPCLSGRRLAVDHCHSTGAVRGLLCGKCNIGLGHFADDPALLVRAARYLEQHQLAGVAECD